MELEDGRYRWIVESALEYAIFTIDGEGTITFWNPGAERLLGWPAEDIVGQPLSAIFVPDDVAAGVHLLEIATAAREGRADDQRWHLRCDGSRFFASGILMQLHDDAGDPAGFVKILRDFTDRQLIEDERDALIEQLRHADLAKDQLLAMVSHELRTPLTILLGTATILAERSATLGPEDRDDAARALHGQALRLRELVEDMLVLARVAPGQQVDLEPVLLQRALPAIAAEHRLRYPARELDFRVDPGLPPALGQPTYIDQVIRNLLSNSEKYASNAHPIVIEAHESHGRIVITYFDKGPPLSPEVVRRLGEPFFRGSAVETGLGMGLTVCRRLIEAQSGDIVIKAREGGGLIVQFSLLA
ncbi:MAG: PAS domain-containing sensor histidine kinase, partial [Dehalococcoidia bacterium]